MLLNFKTVALGHQRCYSNRIGAFRACRPQPCIQVNFEWVVDSTGSEILLKQLMYDLCWRDVISPTLSACDVRMPRILLRGRKRHPLQRCPQPIQTRQEGDCYSQRLQRQHFCL